MFMNNPYTLIFVWRYGIELSELLPNGEKYQKRNYFHGSNKIICYFVSVFVSFLLSLSVNGFWQQDDLIKHTYPSSLRSLGL